MIVQITPPRKIKWWSEMLPDGPDNDGMLYGVLVNPESGMPMKAFIMEDGGFLVPIPIMNYYCLGEDE